MVPLGPREYAAIGKIAVHSAILDDEVVDYLGHLAPVARVPHNLGPKLAVLREYLKDRTEAAHPVGWADLEAIVDKTIELVRQRNTFVHGLWEADPADPKDRTRSIGKNVNSKTRVVEVVSAKDADAIGQGLRNARMLLLHRLHDHCPAAATSFGRPASDPAKLKFELGL
jgi:hypothetical protein